MYVERCPDGEGTRLYLETRTPTSHAPIQIEHNSSSQIWDMEVWLVLEHQLQAVCPLVSVPTLACDHLAAQVLTFFEQMTHK